MSRLLSKTPTEVVQFSYWFFLLCWVIILSVHIVTCVYTALYSYSYWKLQETYLNDYLETFQIGMPPPYHRTIAIVHAIMSALHALCIILMLGGSLWQRSLVFTPWASCYAKEKPQEENSDRTSSAAAKVFNILSDRHGFFGVNGAHFHSLLIVREVIETGLQTVQAYRMSVLLPRTLLNRFYVILLVINCWSSVLVYSVFFKGDEARRRFICIVLDGVLDLMACMGVELLIVLSYASQYNVPLQGFSDYLWRNDLWAARVLNEFRMVVVVSWLDLVSRTIFTLGLIATTTNIKELLQRLPRNKNQVNTGERLSSVAPSLSKSATRTASQQNLLANTRDTCRNRLLRAAHLVFGVLGVIVLALHITASVQPMLPQCILQVRPWATSKPSCYLVGLDCYMLGISGTKEETKGKWSEFDSSTVVQILISHCPKLEIPDSFNEFHGLHGVKVYNSTIIDWGESAAFTSANHPNILSLYLARVNMTDGRLPTGFQSEDFPQNLYDFEFCVTNLRTVPNDLDAKWPKKAYVQIEYSQLTAITEVLLRLEPKFLAVTGNPITQVPPDIFEIPGLITLGLGQMPLSELPRNVTSLSSSISIIFLDETGISFFWPWMDNLTTKETWSVLASGSPYCISLQNIEDGTADTFNVSPSSEYAPILMNPTEENLPIIQYTVSCDAMYAGPYYYIDLDDENIAISPAPALNPA
ncbi:hypothetical protein V7S43_014663 [Phytophthora oleae]|uniref:Uncharacterized protein n=1 Tax=Phytophthora oleae TaxID=2107226 RepID=A0ABD3F4V5_9STRA